MSVETLGWYASIYFWLFFTGIGIPPCPEEAGILYAAGLTALHPQVHWWLAWPAAGAGIISADLVLYGLGWLWGERLFAYRWVRWVLPPEKRQRIETRFHQHGFQIVLMARFIPPLRTGVFLIAGAIRFSLMQFLTADVLYAVGGVGALFCGGTWLIELIHRASHWLAYVAVSLAGVYALYRYYRFLRERERRRGPLPPVSVLEVPAGAGPDGARPA